MCNTNMILNFRLSWVYGFGASARGGHKNTANWPDVNECLENIRNACGSVSLKSGEYPLPVSHHLQVLSEDGNLVLSFGEKHDGGWKVRTYFDHTASSEGICIGGDDWDGRTVFKDFDFVMDVFNEFFTTGKVENSKLV